MSKLSIHWIPEHDQTPILDLIKTIQPASVKIVSGGVPDVQRLADVIAAAPNTLIVMRDYPISEQQDDWKKDPKGTGERHAREWNDHVNEHRKEAQSRSLRFPDNDKFLVLGINEPQVGGDCKPEENPVLWKEQALSYIDRICTYTVAFLDGLKGYGLRGGALNLSVGWPTNWGVPEAPSDWSPFESVHQAILRGNHYLFIHEYWSKDGPQAGWGWYAGRYTQCPWQDVRIIIGECGIDQYTVDDKVDQQKRGWKAYCTPEQYMAQLAEYDARISQDSRIHSAEVFTTDFQDRKWFSFDTDGILDLWQTYAQSHPTPVQPPVAPTLPTSTTFAVGDKITVTTVVNVRSNPGYAGEILSKLQPGDTATISGGPQAADGLVWWESFNGWMAEATPDGHELLTKITLQSDWDRAIAFVLKQEGGLSSDPNDTGNWVDGVFRGTKYGISASAHPNLDIVNLTVDQAKAIYQKDYWPVASAYPWPLCLAVLDLAVNGGVGRAQQAISEAGADFLKVMAWRINWYTHIDGWQNYGLAWTRRCSDLLLEATR